MTHLESVVDAFLVPDPIVAEAMGLEDTFIGLVVFNIGKLDHFLIGVDELAVEVLVGIFDDPQDNGIGIVAIKVDSGLVLHQFHDGPP